MADKKEPVEMAEVDTTEHDLSRHSESHEPKKHTQRWYKDLFDGVCPTCQVPATHKMERAKA